MLKHVAATALALTLTLLVSPAGADRYGHGRPARASDWEKNTRFFASVGYDSSGIINFLTFREGTGKSGWNWQLGASYQLEHPFFVEGGLMGWTLGRQDREDAKEFSIMGSVGVKFRANEFGIGFVPRGGRIFGRRFFEDTAGGKGAYGQVGILFPSVSGTRSFMTLDIGYGF